MYVENKQWVLVLSLHSRQTVWIRHESFCEFHLVMRRDRKIYTDPVFSSVLYKRTLCKEFM